MPMNPRSTSLLFAVLFSTLLLGCEPDRREVREIEEEDDTMIVATGDGSRPPPAAVAPRETDDESFERADRERQREQRREADRQHDWDRQREREQKEAREREARLARERERELKRERERADDEERRERNVRARPGTGAGLAGLMAEGEIDRVASGMAAALRGAPVTSTSMRIAPPAWQNATDIPVDQPAEFLDMLTGMINERTGGNVQFIRRPWAQSPDAGAALPPGVDQLSRVTLLPGSDGSRTARLRLELARPAGDPVVFSHDEPFRLADSRVRRARKSDTKRIEKLEKARREGPSIPTGGGEVLYTKRKYAERIRIDEPSARKLPDGRLQFNARFSVRKKTDVSVQMYFFDPAGNLVEVARPEVRELRSGRPYGFTLTSQLAADRYVALVEED